jgi:cardiolipin synthase
LREGVLEGTSGKSALKRAILETLGESKEVALLSSFLLADRELEKGLFEAASRGVRVYLLTASENRLRAERRADSEEETEMFEEHSALLRRLEGKCFVRTGEDLHAKFIVTDPRSTSPRGVLSTANFTTKALAGNPEIGVVLQGKEAKDLARMFVYGFWHQTQHELAPDGRLLDVRAESTAPRYPSFLPYTARDKPQLQSQLAQTFKEMDGEAWISCYGFEKTHSITKAIVEAVRRGVNLHIMTRPRGGGEAAVKHTDALIDFARSGAEIRSHPDLHAKAIVWTGTEGVCGLVMTANMASRGLDQGYEAGVLIDGKRALALREILQTWWDWMPWEFRVGSRVGNVKGEIKVWRSPAFQDGIVLVQAPEQSMDRVVVDSPEAVQSAQPARFPSPSDGGRLTFYHEVPYRWEVVVKEPPIRKEQPKGKS